MDLEIVTVGDELLLGYTIDTNAADIARTLAGVGARVARHVTVPDDEAAIRNAVAEALRRTTFVIVTGGLGPTSDDVTRGAIAQLFGRALEIDAQYLGQLEERFARIHPGPMPRSNRSQAEVPRGAVTIANPRGTAPGILLEGDLGTVVLLPGVPGEMRAMLQASVLPLVAERVRRAGPPSVIRSRTLRTTGMSESALADLLDPRPDGLDAVTVAFLPERSGVDVRVTAWSVLEEEADTRLSRAVAALRSVLGDRCYGEEGTDLAALVLSQLRLSGMSLAVAESCTGGLLGARLTAVAGASDVFRGGVIAYADTVKVQVLKVPPRILELEGAVSEAVALAMVDGVADRFGADAAIAVTGIAGPTGGTEDKPVGTVWTAVRVGTTRQAVHRIFPGSRDNVRRRSAQAALDLLRTLLAAPGD